ncbi:MAG: hypothetical protein KGL43_28165, partial [Burkholderiales bacterium]|nr:hypothetical protein [Burkholderiales bacterium]
MKTFGSTTSAAAIVATVLALAGCGGGGSGGSTSAVTLSGTATKGPLNGATVTAYPIDSSGKA